MVIAIDEVWEIFSEGELEMQVWWRWHLVLRKDILGQMASYEYGEERAPQVNTVKLRSESESVHVYVCVNMYVSVCKGVCSGEVEWKLGDKW